MGRLTDSRLAAALRRGLRPLCLALFVLLGLVLLFGRLPLPGGESFGYSSFARNLVLLVLTGLLVRAPGLRLRPSPLDVPLLVFVAAAVLSVAVNGGLWGDLRIFATAVGVFFVARILAPGPERRRWLFHGLGLFAVGVMLRELLHKPTLLTFQEAYRLDLVTDHANTLGYGFALLAPIFLAGTVPRERRWPALLYSACACLGILITFSRAAWLGLAFTVMALALATRPRRVALNAISLTLVTAAAVAAATGYLTLGRTEADSQRLRIIEASLSLFREHFAFGIGFGIKNLERFFPARYIELYGESLFLFHSHNFYVDLLTGTGLVGTLAAAWLLWRLVRMVVHRVSTSRGEGERFEAVACAVSVALFLLIGFVDMPFYHGRLNFLIMILWAMIEAPRADTGDA